MPENKCTSVSALLFAALLLQSEAATAQEEAEFVFDESATAVESATTADVAPVAPVAEDATAQAAASEAPVEPAEASPEMLETIPLAAEAPAPVETARPTSRLIEEIVVTAQKREEAIHDVPISIQAFTADKLDVLGVRDVQNLPLITPGLTVTTQVAYTSTYIRGVGSDAFLLADPSVATYYDGIYQPFPNGLVQDFGAIERVEVLKGPQGTLFGRNAVGGAINIINRAPNLDEFELSIQTSYETHSMSKTRGYVSIPLFGMAAISLSGVYNDGEYHVDGTAAGKPLPNIRAKGGRVQLRVQPAEWMELQLTGFKVENDGPTTSYTPNAHPYAVLGAVIPRQDPYAGAVDEDLFYGHTNETMYGRLSFYTPYLDIRLYASDQDTRSSFNYDFDSSPVPLALFQIDNVFAEVQTAELQFVSNDTSPGNDWLKWIVGGYYFKSKTGFDPSFLRVGGLNLAEGIILNRQIPGLGALVSRLLNNGIVPTGDINFYGLLGTESIAGFAQFTVDITEQLALTLGGRYQREEREIIRSSSELRTVNGGLISIQDYRAGQTPTLLGIPTGFGPDLVDVTESFELKVSVEFRPLGNWLGEGALLYGSWQTATKSSTYNTVNIYDPPDLVRPEEITAYELGLKTSLFDGLMQVNLALFDYEIKDQQVQFISLLAGGAVTFENAGSVEVQGVELDFLTPLFPNTIDDLVISAGAAYVDARYKNFTNGSGFNALGVLTRNNDFSGNQVVRSPKWTGQVGLSKTFWTGVGPLELGATYYYNSGFYYSAQNDKNAMEPEYDLLNARISLLFDNWGLRVTAFGDNILGTKYSVSKFISDFGIGEARAPKEIFGIRLQYDLQ